jgi:hypothetical protein
MSTRTTRSLRPRSTRAHPGPHACLSSHPSKQSGFGLFEYLDFSVVTMHTEVRQSSVGGLVD